MKHLESCGRPRDTRDKNGVISKKHGSCAAIATPDHLAHELGDARK